MFKCLKKDPRKPTREYAGYGEEGDKFKPAWGLVLPHYKRDGGADTVDGKYSEYTYAKEMYPLITQVPKDLHDHRNDGDVSGAAKRLKAKGVNCYLECHEDAYNNKVDGFSFLYLKGDNLSKKYASIFRDMAIKMNPDRTARYSNGLKGLKSGDPGYRNLVKIKKYMDVAIYSEYFFIDNPDAFIAPDKQAKFWNKVL